MHWCIKVSNITVTPLSGSSTINFHIVYGVFLIPVHLCAAQTLEREDRRSGNHEFDWLRDRPSNRLGNVPGAYKVSYAENFKLKWAGLAGHSSNYVVSCISRSQSRPTEYCTGGVGWRSFLAQCALAHETLLRTAAGNFLTKGQGQNRLHCIVRGLS